MSHRVPCRLARELLLDDVGVGRRLSSAVVVTNVLRAAVECYLLADVSPAAFLSLVGWSPFVLVVSVIIESSVREGCIDRLLFSECVLVYIFRCDEVWVFCALAHKLCKTLDLFNEFGCDRISVIIVIICK